MTTGTILVVEDEDQVRTLIVRLLERRGYTVVQADNGKSALDLVENNLADLALVVTDVVMPEMGGAELMQELRKRRPDLRALYMTGYTRDEVATTDGLEDGSFIEKPFTPTVFLDEVAELMK